MKLLVTDKINFEALKPLEKYFTIDKHIAISQQTLKKIIADYDCVITRSATALPDEIIANAKNLKIIVRAGIGVDNIDIFSATRHKIAVINAPKGNARATAEHTIGLIFALLRYIPQAHHDLIKGLWNKQKYVGCQVYGKTLGIVGFGNVGKEVYQMAQGLDMKVIVCEPYIRLPQNVRHVTYEELLKKSDIITFHVPATYLTKHMLNKNTIKLCQDGVYIINCSRAEVIEEKAIKEALSSGKIKGIALDVFSKAPQVDQTLLKFPQVIATPHIAGSTIESQKHSVNEIIQGIISFLNNKPPPNLLNPQVFEKKAKKTPSKSLGFDAVIFDCDSTLSTIEGIDELAAFYNKKKDISPLTRLAMEGLLNFEEVFHKRLEILKPSKNNLEKLGESYINNLAEDAIPTIKALKLLGKKIYIISSSYAPALFKLSQKLGIPEKNIFANDLIFDEKGNFLQYIEGPLKRNHGKLQIVRQIRGRKIMIGDGITDLEAKHLSHLFVGFGGVARRKIVEQQSDIYLYSKSLTPIIVLAAGVDGAIKLLDTPYKKFIGKGLDLLSHPKHTKIKRSQKSALEDFKKLAYF